jgi:hypothetical protein
LPDFLGKTCQRGKNVPNDRKIYQMTTKYTYILDEKIYKMSIIGPLQDAPIYPNLEIYHLATLPIRDRPFASDVQSLIYLTQSSRHYINNACVHKLNKMLMTNK